MRVGPAPTPPCAEVPLGLQDARSRGSSCLAVLGPRFHSPSPSGCVSYCPFGAGRGLRGVWAFTWRARLPPGVQLCPLGGEARLSAAAHLQRLFLPLVRGRSEGPHVAGAGGGLSRSHGGQEAAGPRSVPSQSGLSGRLLVLRFMFGDTVTHPGSCPTRPPGRVTARGLESRRPPGWMRPGRRPQGDAEGRGGRPRAVGSGPAPQHRFVQCPGAGLCHRCCWGAAPHPRLRS